MNRRLMRMLEPRFRLCFVILVIFALLSFFIRPWVAAAELLIVLVVYLQFRHATYKRNKAVFQYVESMMYDVDVATKDSMINFPMPMAILKLENNEILWYNDQFMNMTGEHEHVFEIHLRDIMPELDIHWALEGKTQCPTELKVGDKFYHVFGNMVRPTGDEGNGTILITLYWVEISEYVKLREEYQKTRQIVSLLVIDNFEELMKGVDESRRSAILAEVDSKIGAWIESAHGILLKLERDRYLFIFEEQYLAGYQEQKFSILDAVREVESSNGMRATLSIGIGKDGQDFGESYKFAQLAIDMSLSRGGDQAVIRNKFNFEFFGGRSKELEKRTKVKSRVMANALAELIKDSSGVLIMGHKNADNDSVGAAIGLMSIVRKFGKSGSIVMNVQENTAVSLCEKLIHEDYYENIFITAEDAILEADGNTLLIVVDTNRPQYVESPSLLESVNKVAVVDHHRRAAEYIDNAVLNFHEPYASSTCELVTELLQYLVETPDILHCEAEALLAGIVLDTKNFTMKTGVRTFEAAAFLRRAGADTVEIKRLYQNDLTSYVRRAEIVKMAKMYHGDIAIAAYNGESDRITAAQAADELLSITKVQASFVLYKDGETIVISARSFGNINVQVILEKLGGGGHLATAGAQVKNATLEQVLEKLIQAIHEVVDDE